MLCAAKLGVAHAGEWLAGFALVRGGAPLNLEQYLNSAKDDDEALSRAGEHARRWLASLEDRRVPPFGTADDARERLGHELPEHPRRPSEVIDHLAAAVEPGLMASSSGRFYGWVRGGAFPVALAADWLIAAWDQNASMRDWAPGVVAVEEVAGEWMLQLLGLPATSSVGFVTGGTMANFACLAAGRERVLDRAGWDVTASGLTGAPRVRVLAGAERHTSIDLALRYLGLGAPQVVAADDQGRIDPHDLRQRLAEGEGPAIVCLQAGNIHSGAFDPFRTAIQVAREHGAWVHVDGAFGLWAAASASLAHLTDGLQLADSWATDAHKMLNVPYDCGVAIVADAAAARKAMFVQADYLPQKASEDPYHYVPEMSRRARGVPVWAALSALGAEGLRSLIDRLVASARAIAEGLERVPGARVLNDVVYNQVCVAFDSDERTLEVFERVLAEGIVMPSPSVWRGKAVIRVSVTNWRTGPDEVRATVDAFARAVGAKAPS